MQKLTQYQHGLSDACSGPDSLLCNDSAIVNTGMSAIRLSPLSPFNWAMDHGDILAILTQSQTKSNAKK